MSKRCSAVRGRILGAAAGILTGLCLFTVLSISPAEARHRHHHHHHYARHFRHHPKVVFHLRHMRRSATSDPRFAALVVDGYTGRELYGRNENALRHPASITKVMTLYLLFEQLQKGRLRLDSQIPISAHAAAQAPTKIGLRPGQTISVENAIKAIVTQSANDIAVAVAEKIGGTESNFAAIMTRKAHELGMLRTHYANASGLPNDEQLTTAHDLAILGRDIQARFPQYYHYFSLRSFHYHGITYHNHNHLLGHVDGMDGIKTGYTRASGFNLLTSVKRDHHFIIAVVLGGATSVSRNRIMENLIEAHIDDGSKGGRITMFAQGHQRGDEGDGDAQAVRSDNAPIKAAATTPPARPSEATDPLPIEPSRNGATARPRPAFVSAAPKPTPIEGDHYFRTRRASYDGSTDRPTASSATPTSLRWVVGPAPVKETAAEARSLAKEQREFAKAEAGHLGTDVTVTGSIRSDHPAAAHSGWMIQIGATDERAAATDLLARAKAKDVRALRGAKPFTEKFQKGSETFYRARFAGLEERTAEAACKSLKRSGFACFATKN